MTNPKEDELAVCVQQLAVRFVARTHAEIDDLLPLAERMCSNADGHTSLLLKQWAHRIHGTAASLGLATVSDLARGIEQMLDDGKHDDTACACNVLDQIRAIADVLGAYCRELSSPTVSSDPHARA